MTSPCASAGERQACAPDGLSPDLLVADVLARWPQALPVFVRHRMACPGCTMGCFETLAEAASVYGLRVGCFLEELGASLTGKASPRRRAGGGKASRREEREDGIRRRP